MMLGAGNTLDSLCRQHKVRVPTPPIVGTTPSIAQKAQPAPGNAPNPADVSSLLNMMLPGTVNPHVQWYQQNCAAHSAPAKTAVPAPVASFHQTMDVPLPDIADQQVCVLTYLHNFDWFVAVSVTSNDSCLG
jgi:hypothetical protein